MYDSRSENGSRKHAPRWNGRRESLFAGYNVFGPTYRTLHQAPALTIEEQIRDYQDDLEILNVLNDGIKTFQVADVCEIAEDGTVSYSTSTPKALAVLIDTAAKAKQQNRAKIEALMAQGVRFPDLDPYTLEPIQKNYAVRGVAKQVRTKRNTYR